MEEDLHVFIHPINTLITSNLILDLRVNYPSWKLIFYGLVDSTIDPLYQEIIDRKVDS
jgi:hypothetical protein